jgi:hypothetical protein
LIVIPTTDGELPRLPFDLQAVDVEEARSGVDTTVTAPELTVDHEVLGDVEQGKYFGEPPANLGITSLDTARRPVVEMSVAREHGVEHLPVEAVDGGGIPGQEIVHADPIFHDDVVDVHVGRG